MTRVATLHQQRPGGVDDGESGQADTMENLVETLRKAKLDLKRCLEEKRRLAGLLQDAIAEKDSALEQLEAIK